MAPEVSETRQEKVSLWTSKVKVSKKKLSKKKFLRTTKNGFGENGLVENVVDSIEDLASRVLMKSTSKTWELSKTVQE